MTHFFSVVGSTVLCAGRPVDRIDADRIAGAGRLVREQRVSPLAAHLVACRGWPLPVAQAYSLLGLDAGRVLNYGDALATARARGLVR